LSHTEIAAWARLTDRNVEPYEATALIAIDAVMRTDEAETTEPEPPRDEAWPERKG
jgi:hypothetical protein